MASWRGARVASLIPLRDRPRAACEWALPFPSRGALAVARQGFEFESCTLFPIHPPPFLLQQRAQRSIYHCTRPQHDIHSLPRKIYVLVLTRHLTSLHCGTL